MQAFKAADQWNGKSGVAKLGRVFRRGSNVDINVSVNVIMSDNPASETTNDVKTRVDFGETIGSYVDPETGEAVETTIGIVHNSKKGAHIVPARPKKIDE